MSELDYVPARVPDDCTLRISPSSFANFIERPWNWYRTTVLGLDKFEYNTASVLGTVVHYCAEKYAKGLDVNEKEISKYIAKHKVKEDYFPEEVATNWRSMAIALVNGYVAHNKDNYLYTEEQVCASLKDGAYVAGTVDVVEGTKEDAVLTDYKTYSSKTKPKSIPKNYYYQLLTYAYILREQGVNVQRVRLVYVNRNIEGELSQKTGKKLKSYPPEVTVLTQVITDEDINYIKSMLDLCKETVQVTKSNPELAHVIWHDPRLKNI